MEEFFSKDPMSTSISICPCPPVYIVNLLKLVSLAFFSSLWPTEKSSLTLGEIFLTRTSYNYTNKVLFLGEDKTGFDATRFGKRRPNYTKFDDSSHFISRLRSEIMAFKQTMDENLPPYSSYRFLNHNIIVAFLLMFWLIFRTCMRWMILKPSNQNEVVRKLISTDPRFASRYHLVKMRGFRRSL